MAINEWKIWKKIGIVKEKKEYVDIDKSMDIILNFLNEIKPTADELAKLYGQFQSLRKMELKLRKEKAGNHALKDNMQKQIRKYDQILKAYELLELDTDVNGERVKKIADELTNKARKLNVNKDLLDKVTRSEHWTFDW
jgi:DNA repair ATPase RecN